MRWNRSAGSQLIGPLLRGFYWYDDGLQSYLRSKGWHSISRPQSMVMVAVVGGAVRPAEIARNLGISRQAAHVTIQQLVDEGMLVLLPDPGDRRSKIVARSDKGYAMGNDATEAMQLLEVELVQRIGRHHVDNLVAAFSADWGEPADFERT